MRAVVVAHGEPDDADRDHVVGADLVVAADGGALILERWGIAPHLVVGDLDSLGAEVAARLRASGTRVVAHPAEKDETDLELGVRAAREAGADAITLVGAFGGLRLDHEIANALLLADGAGLVAVRGATRASVVRAGERVSLDGGVGDLVTLLPLSGDAEGVVTEGLRYPLRGEALRFAKGRGVSNEIVALPAAVTGGRGMLLLIHTRRAG